MLIFRAKRLRTLMNIKKEESGGMKLRRSLREFFRFSGPFAECGHMSMICAFLLYANRFNLQQWYNIVFFISVLFSLSLAGYVLLGLGLLLYSMKLVIVLRTSILLMMIIKIVNYLMLVLLIFFYQ